MALPIDPETGDVRRLNLDWNEADLDDVIFIGEIVEANQLVWTKDAARFKSFLVNCTTNWTAEEIGAVKLRELDQLVTLLGEAMGGVEDEAVNPTTETPSEPGPQEAEKAASQSGSKSSSSQSNGEKPRPTSSDGEGGEK